jgi:hypothetical protein
MALAAASAASDIVVSSPWARDALDGLTTFDLRPLSALAEDFFPGKGAESVDVGVLVGSSTRG